MTAHSAWLLLSYDELSLLNRRRKLLEMKSRYRLMAYPSRYGRMSLHQILEATEGSLRLLAPTRLDHLVHLLISLGIFFGPLVALPVLAGIRIPVQTFGAVSVVIGSILTVGFFAALYFLDELPDRLGVGVELRLTARHPGRILSVHVREVRTVGRAWVQLVGLAGDGKEGWLTVQATRGKLEEALSLAGETIFAQGKDKARSP